MTKTKAEKVVKEKKTGKPSGAPSLKEKVERKKPMEYFISIFRIEGNPLYRSMIQSKKEVVFDGKVPPVITDIIWYRIDKETGKLTKEK